ncbi:hypothetical protein Ae505Ps2_4919 [Pseudonocardia sp. Ae505_Ps2]|nr:hypothetical protein Ae505Ps2_4919 [Pseudonocardia sp. Ae505_Ps2]
MHLPSSPRSRPGGARQAPAPPVRPRERSGGATVALSSAGGGRRCRQVRPAAPRPAFNPRGAPFRGQLICTICGM